MFTSCKKEAVKEVIDQTEVEVAALENQTDGDVTEADVIADETSEELYIEGEGLAADWIVEEEDMDVVQGPAGGNDAKSIRAYVRKRSFIKCLSGLNLDKTQIKKIRSSIGEYKKCRVSAVTRARVIYNNIKKTYVAKYQSLLKEFKAGKITRKELVEGTARLRKAFINDVRVAHLKKNFTLQSAIVIRRSYAIYMV